MSKLSWIIVDAASYDIVEKLISENALECLKIISEKGIGTKMKIHPFNCQTPCALAVQFTGMMPWELDIGGYHTPNYMAEGNEKLKYELSFKNRYVADNVCWHNKNIGNKKIKLCQIPYYNDDVNEIQLINGYSEKIYGYTLMYYDEINWKKANDTQETVINLYGDIYKIVLNNDRKRLLLENQKCGKKINIGINENENNDFWITEDTGFKFFAFDLNDEHKMMLLFTDVWKYQLHNITIDEHFRNEVGTFLGGAYGRLYRNKKFGTNYYYGGDGTAEKIYLKMLNQLAACFEKMNMFMLKKIDYELIIAYQPCVDDASHEFYGWWKNSEGKDKQFYWNIMKKAYMLADHHIKMIYSQLDREDSVMVTSDHGIYSVSYNYYINEYLYEKKHLLYADEGEIDVKRSELYYHPANTGALYFNEALSEDKKQNIIQELCSLNIDGRKVIRELKKTDGKKVFGDYFIIPEAEINLSPQRSKCLLEITPKTGCHTINIGVSSMDAIFFAQGKRVLDNCSNNISNTDIRNVIINSIKS